MRLIDSEDLTCRIQYSAGWNNTPCPDWVLGVIRATPAREIVTCGECKHREAVSLRLPDRHRCGFMEVYVEDEDYCSFGEKKDG